VIIFGVDVVVWCCLYPFYAFFSLAVRAGVRWAIYRRFYGDFLRVLYSGLVYI
jgi:hypothetical protein